MNSPRPCALIRFGAFELDLRSRELRKGGRSTGIPEQSIMVLQMLLERPGELVLRDEIRLRLWPNNTVVEFDHSINTAIRKLRLALGDSADTPRCIETLARRGYRWIGALEAVEVPGAIDAPRTPPVRPDPSHRELTGRRVSHYRVLEVLGGGGMGVVYKAEDLRLGRRVALKFLPEELAQDPAALNRLEQEARAASALNHPNVCTIYEIAEHEGSRFIVMEFLEGETLREHISVQRGESLRPSLQQQMDVAIQVSGALAAAHASGVIHRDIKPANIFVTRAGVAKVLDFGVAKLTQATSAEDGKSLEANPVELKATRPADSGSSAAPADPALTRTGVTLGTAAYMSPEQVRGEALDGRTDLFSFGLVLYEMATGRAAFGAATPALMREAILQHEPTPARELNPAVPDGLALIIRKALEKTREQRYQSAAQMRVDLEAQAAVLRGRGEPTGRGGSQASSFRQRLRRPIWWLGAAVAGAALLICGLLTFSVSRPIALARSDRVLISDFVNTTGTPIFDGTLRQAVAVKLAESPYFSLVPDSRLRKTLKLLNRADDERIVPPLSREVCRQAGASVVVDGSIVAAGSNYDLALRATNCATGANLATERIHAFDQAQTLGNLQEALRTLRRDLGESVASIQRFDTPIEKAAGKSLAALRAYTLGEQKRAQGKESESLIDYKLAAELDPDFAMAYARLSAVSRSQNQLDLADEYMRKAYDLREQLGEKDKLYIQARYYSDAVHESENEIEAYSLWAQVYPNDFYPFNGLTSAYIEVGQADKAVAAGLQALQLNPEHALPYASLSRAYERASRFAEAKALCDKAIAEKVDAFWIHTVLFRVAFVENDRPGMQRALDWFKGKPQESSLAYYQASSALSLGQVGRSRELFGRARQLAEGKGLKEQSISILNGQAQFEAEIGLDRTARVALDAVLQDAPPSRRHLAYAVLALARSGDVNRAEALLKEMESHPVPGTGLNEVVLPAIRAAVALNRGEPSLVLQALQRSIPYDLGTESGGMTNYYRGLALLQMKSGKEAAAEFQNIVDNPGVAAIAVYWPLAHLGLARAHAMIGDTNQSLVHYRYFLTYWKDADSDLAILREAKSEYSRLGGEQVAR